MRTSILRLSTRTLPRGRTSNNPVQKFARQQPALCFLHFSTATAQAPNADATTTSSNAHHNSSTNKGDMHHIQTRLAQAALKQVPMHGWTQEAITTAAVQDPKLSISMAGMLSPIDLVHWFMDDMNRQLREKQQADDDTFDKDKMFQSIQWRLQQVIPLVQCGEWSKGMALGISTPVTTKAQLHEFIEIISPPNVSTEYQAALGAIFVATELHLLTDTSVDYRDTWFFLEQRLDDLEANKDSNPAQIMASALPSSVNPLDASIPLMASMAVASSLMEGAASLLMPGSSNNNVLPGINNNVPGTKASDYSHPSWKK